VRSDADQASYFEEGLRTTIRERMTVTGREPYNEIVQMALRTEKLTAESRRVREAFAKRRGSVFSQGQPSKKAKTAPAPGVTASTFVDSVRSPQ